MKFRIGVMIGALCVTMGMTHVQATSETQEVKAETKGSFRFTDDFSDAKVIGKGAHRYRMVLLDPLYKHPLANQDYALSHSQVNLTFVKESKKVFQGTTDAQGRTAVFAFPKAVPKSGWNLRPRTGSGPLGEQMVVMSNEDEVYSKFPYSLLVCEQDDAYIYRGRTDASGQTAYVASEKPVQIYLYMTGYEPKEADICKKLHQQRQSINKSE